MGIGWHRERSWTAALFPTRATKCRSWQWREPMLAIKFVIPQPDELLTLSASQGLILGIVAVSFHIRLQLGQHSHFPLHSQFTLGALMNVAHVTHHDLR